MEWEGTAGSFFFNDESPCYLREELYHLRASRNANTDISCNHLHRASWPGGRAHQKASSSMTRVHAIKGRRCTVYIRLGMLTLPSMVIIYTVPLDGVGGHIEKRLLHWQYFILSRVGGVPSRCIWSITTKYTPFRPRDVEAFMLSIVRSVYNQIVWRYKK